MSTLSPTLVLTTDIPTAPRRQNSVRMTFKTLSKSSSAVSPLHSRMDKDKSHKSRTLSRSSSREDASEDGSSNGNNNNEDNCTSPATRVISGTSSMRSPKLQDHSPLLTTLFKSPKMGSQTGGHNSLPMFPTIKEDELMVTKGTSRLIIEGPVFACPLPELLVKETKISRGEYKIFIPYLVENCVVILMKEEVLKQEGIFRQSGRLIDNQLMKSYYDKGKYVNLDEYPDSYTIAALLKLYLRELPEPLLTHNMYSTFLDLGRTVVDGKDAPVEELKEQLKTLPLANKSILKILMELLAKTASLESSNKMTSSNLAIVIAPNIMWSNKHKSTIDVVNDTPAINQVASMLIANGMTLFDGDGDLKSVTLDILTQQHSSLTIPFPSFAEVQIEEERLKEQTPKKKNFIEKAFAKMRE